MAKDKSKAKEKNKSSAESKAATAARTNDFLLPSVLSFQRSIECVDGTMTAERTRNGVVETKDLLVFDHGIRTAKSHESTKGKGDTLRSGEDSANLVYGQQAKLPPGFDTLVVNTNIRFTPINADPYSCASDLWFHALTNRINDCRHTKTIRTLARLYAYNIANASWLWRNRTSADKIRLDITFNDETLIIEDALNLYPTPVMNALSSEEDPHTTCPEIDPLAAAIEATLNGEQRWLRIDVTARASMMPGQSVWPSQLLRPVKRVIGKTDKGDELTSGRDFYMFGDMPALGTDKIGNALRTFDRDHGHDVFPEAIIPIEPNGGSLRYGINLRRPGNDLRSLLPIFIGLKKNEASSKDISLSDKEELYVIACIIRGGVFGGSNKEAIVASTKEAAASVED